VQRHLVLVAEPARRHGAQRQLVIIGDTSLRTAATISESRLPVNGPATV
jgi:hypothetical protein